MCLLACLCLPACLPREPAWRGDSRWQAPAPALVSLCPCLSACAMPACLRGLLLVRLTYLPALTCLRLPAHPPALPQVDYKQPVPAGTSICCSATVEKVEGRKVGSLEGRATGLLCGATQSQQLELVLRWRQPSPMRRCCA